MTGARHDLFEIGDLLEGRYRLIEPIASGGMSTVWRAHDERLGRMVAVKALDRKLLTGAVSRSRLRAEARVLARLSHPNIAVIHDYGVSAVDGQIVPFLVMEAVDGVPLADALQRRAVPWQEAVTVAAQIAGALEAAHARGVVHRDVSPRNVLLTASGVKVIDFGISAFQGDNETGPGSDVLGTPAYTAPERLEGAAVHPAADVHGLGILLYLMLAGRLPWQPRSMLDLLSAHRSQVPDPLPEIDDLPVPIAEACMACLAKDPAARPGAAELAATLSAALDGTVRLPGHGTLLAALAGDGVPDVAAPGPMTRILEWTTQPVTEGLRTGRRRILAGGVAAATGALIWLAAAWLPMSPDGGQPRWTSAPASAAGPGCVVAYQVTANGRERFTAAVAVTNTGQEPWRDWRLRFRLPGDERVDEALATLWRQDGATITSRVQSQPLPAGATAHLSLTGRDGGGTGVPTGFTVDESNCVPNVITTSPSVTSAPERAGARGAGAGWGNGGSGKGKGKRHAGKDD